jgi:hypothetical protein
MTFEEFKEDVFNNIKDLPENWRKGQKVFNYIERKYGVARTVQFNCNIDCFYNDNLIDEFVKKSYDCLNSLIN